MGATGLLGALEKQTALHQLFSGDVFKLLGNHNWARNMQLNYKRGL